MHRTESTDSIKVSYRPKRTFIEKWQHPEDGNLEEMEALGGIKEENKPQTPRNLLQKFKRTSNRMMGRKKQAVSPVNVQNPSVGLNDLQL